MNLEAPVRHRIERVRREPKRRRLTVAERHRPDAENAPHHVRLARARRLLEPRRRRPRQAVRRRPRDRRIGPRCATTRRAPSIAEKGELTIDFALHDAGPATAWALAAKAGDALEIGGPRGSMVVADDFDYLLAHRRRDGAARDRPARRGVARRRVRHHRRDRRRSRGAAGLRDAAPTGARSGSFATARATPRRSGSALTKLRVGHGDGYRLDRGGGEDRPRAARLRAQRARPSQDLAQGLRLLGGRRARG